MFVSVSVLVAIGFQPGFVAIWPESYTRSMALCRDEVAFAAMAPSFKSAEG